MTGKWCRVGTAGSGEIFVDKSRRSRGGQAKHWPIVRDEGFTSGHSPVASSGNAGVFYTDLE